MIQRRQRKKHRFFATLLCFCVLFTMPGIQNVFPVTAAGQEESFRQESIIMAFDPLSEEIKVQTVFAGTDRNELDLPEELTVYLLWESSEQKEEKGEQENTGETYDIEEDSDTETESEQDTQLEESKGLEETDETAVTDSEDIADTKDEGNSTGESVPSKEQQESETIQETHTVTMLEYHAENVIPVQTLENTQTEKHEGAVTIDGVTWQSVPEYNGSVGGMYIFTAVLPDGYALAEGVSLPQITVTVKESESGTDSVIQALYDRIAALPKVEEYLATEPDMDDENVYTEWEDTLYEYAEEARAIWEEYEALTGEQQAQISEEEMARLTAWLEIAETLTESSKVMATNDVNHTHCICGGNKNIGNHTNHPNIEYKMLTTNGSGQLLIDGVSQDNYTLTTGNYYLPEPYNPGDKTEIEIGTITINGNVTLCLNGGTLKHSGETGSVIEVSGGSTFTLCDCKSDTGCITGGKGHVEGDVRYGGGIYMYPGTTFNMFGGVIRENTCAGGGAGINCAGTRDDPNSEINIYGGKIIDNLCITGMGGGMSAGYAQVKIFGGTIEGNTARRGGGG